MRARTGKGKTIKRVRPKDDLTLKIQPRWEVGGGGVEKTGGGYADTMTKRSGNLSDERVGK